MEPSKWDARYLDLATLVSSWSKDRSTKVGCVFVGNAGQVLATGYNGFPRGINDDIDERHERPLKYKWTEHAERNAIYNSARKGVSLEGSTAYVPWFPCTDCARALIQSGITTLVTPWTPFPGGWKPNHRWDEDFRISQKMLEEAGVAIRWYEPESRPSLES